MPLEIFQSLLLKIFDCLKAQRLVLITGVDKLPAKIFCVGCLLGCYDPTYTLEIVYISWLNLQVIQIINVYTKSFFIELCYQSLQHLDICGCKPS